MISNLLQPYTPYLLIASILLAILSFILVIVALSSNARLRRQVKQWKSIHSSADLETVYEETVEAVRALRHQVRAYDEDIHTLKEQMKSKVSRPAMHRYNAFADVGSDLSYSVAFLDDNRDGIVLTSIYGRGESRTYGKPIAQGDSVYKLSDEEKRAIQACLNGEAETRVPVQS